jgi:hypothetical protein
LGSEAGADKVLKLGSTIPKQRTDLLLWKN